MTKVASVLALFNKFCLTKSLDPLSETDKIYSKTALKLNSKIMTILLKP